MKKFTLIAVALLLTLPAFAGVARTAYHGSKFAGKKAYHGGKYASKKSAHGAVKTAKIAKTVLY